MFGAVNQITGHGLVVRKNLGDGTRRSGPLSAKEAIFSRCHRGHLIAAKRRFLSRNLWKTKCGVISRVLFSQMLF